MEKEPQTLQEAIVCFANPDNCIDYLAIRRWPSGVTCPGCGSQKVSFNRKRRTWKCGSHHPKREFSVKVGTIFEDSPISLDKWLTATWMLTNCKNGVSSYEIARDIKVTQKSAWFMLHRIRLAMQDDSFGSKFGSEGEGEVEVDETFVGGKFQNMHKDKKEAVPQLANDVPRWKNYERYPGKTAVMGILDRELRRVRAKVVPDVKRETLQCEILNQVEFGAGEAVFG
jgi:transposase-like protein